MSNTADFEKTHAYLVGGGIASLASAAYLIRDGHIKGEHIHILEESAQTGGSLDAHGSPDQGYVMRGGRMFDEEAYRDTGGSAPYPVQPIRFGRPATGEVAARAGI